MTLLFAFIAGLIFGLGLILSGMTNTANIQNFLDITGHWDPSLMFVMAGALMVSAVSFMLIKARSSSLLGVAIDLPKKSIIDQKLVTGAALFGVGWGLVGFCPGPAIVSLVTQPPQAGLFVISMVSGMLLFNVLNK